MLVDLHLEFSASELGDEALGSALIAQRWAWQHIGDLIRGQSVKQPDAAAYTRLCSLMLINPSKYTACFSGLLSTG